MQRKLLCSLILTISLVIFLSCSAFAAPILQQGAEGHDVLVLQQNLKSLGYNVEPDGVFGYTTYRAVIAFQRDEKLKINGKVDRTTWRALKNRTEKTGSDKSEDDKKKNPASPTGQEKPSAPKTDEIPGSTKTPESAPFLLPKKADDIIKTAKKYTGTRYRFGGTTPKGFDCSGFVQYVFKQNGITIPRTADEQYTLGKRIKKRAELEPGDLVFFSTYEPGASHCGIYLGKNQFIHVSSSKGVRIDSLDDSYWKPRWFGGKHIVKN